MAINVLEGIMEEEKQELEQVESSESAIKYKLQDFEGPLDLLLHLIKEKKMDIMVTQ